MYKQKASLIWLESFVFYIIRRRRKRTDQAKYIFSHIRLKILRSRLKFWLENVCVHHMWETFHVWKNMTANQLFLTKISVQEMLCTLWVFNTYNFQVVHWRDFVALIFPHQAEKKTQHLFLIYVIHRYFRSRKATNLKPIRWSVSHHMH